MLVTRAVSDWMHSVAMQVHTFWIGVAISVPLLWRANDGAMLALESVWPEGRKWLWLFGVGFWAAGSHMCMTYALKFAPLATLAPLHYSEIVVAVIRGGDRGDC